MSLINTFIHIYIKILDAITKEKSVVVTQYLLWLDIISKIIEIFSFSMLSPEIDFNSNFNSSFSSKIILILESKQANMHKTKFIKMKKIIIYNYLLLLMKKRN